jgi:uncharacterized membrane protein
MAENDVTPQEAESFKALLAPHRSLSPTGFVLFMAGVGVVSFATGITFLMLGAWPVFGFLGLDVLLVYIAFRLSYRSGRQYEVIDLTRERLTLTRVDPSGRSEVFTFNPYWVQVNLEPSHNGHSRLSPPPTAASCRSRASSPTMSGPNSRWCCARLSSKRGAACPFDSRQLAVPPERDQSQGRASADFFS